MRVGLNTYGVDHDDLCRAMVAEHAASLDHVTILRDTFKNAKTTALDILDPSEAKRWVAYDARGGKQTEAVWKDVGSSSALVHADSNSEHELDVTVIDLSETTARASAWPTRSFTSERMNSSASSRMSSRHLYASVSPITP